MSPHESVWHATAPMPNRGPLKEDIETGVCIVGAGIVGLSTAYALTRAGEQVVVIDDGVLAGGETQMTTAHLSNAIDDRIYEIERIHGTTGAHLAIQSHGAAIDRIEEIVRDEKIDCDFARVHGFLFRSPEDSEDVLVRELEAAHRAGWSEVEMLPNLPVETLGQGPCLRFPYQGQFHPLKYLAGIVNAIERGGGKIYTRTHVDIIDHGPPVVVFAGGFTVTANALVVATNTPINNRLVIHTKQSAYMSYVVGLRIPPDTVPRALYWDTGDPYHYIRTQSTREGEVLIVGGEDHKIGQAADTAQRYHRVERWARARFPMATDTLFRWSGEVMETIDGLAFIGRNPLGVHNVYIATGDSGMGLTHGTIASMLITDLIRGEENPWTDLYSPSRKPLRALPAFAKDAANMAAQYTDWITGGDGSEDEMQPDTGLVIRRGLKKVAIYCDEGGNHHEFSAVCPHLGGIVHWNAAEKTWDCPCHGSRFDKYGTCIHGPANSALTEETLKEPETTTLTR